MEIESSFLLAAYFLTPVAHLNQVWYIVETVLLRIIIGSNSTCASSHEHNGCVLSFIIIILKFQGACMLVLCTY